MKSHRVLLTTYEIKQWRRWNIDSVFEAASQRRFSNQAYLVLEWAKGEEIVGLEEMLSVCSRFGVGLITLHAYYKSFRYAIQLDAEEHSVSEDRAEEFLDYVFQKDDLAKKAYEDLYV